ncbi:MAG: hypothetical protein WCK09_01335 [Bacteroidota bacterium]
MKTEYKQTFPICFVSKTSLLMFKKEMFITCNIDNGEITDQIELNTTILNKIITRIPFLARILRKGVRCGIKVSDNLFLFTIGQTIYELDTSNASISEGFRTEDQSRPLTFSKIEGISGFDDGIYFGGYRGNPDKNPISIYRRLGTDHWEEVYRFPKNTIEHIHNIVADPFKNVVYILTGDFEASAGIWKAENGFKTIKPILNGAQTYRACVAFPTPDGLVYATDSPFSNNSIRILKECGNSWESMQLMDINGPSIYGCQWGGDFLFSTSVEGDGRNQSIWYKLFGHQRGSGIKENYSFIYKGNLDIGFSEFYKVKKDILPFHLFQFGTLIFANGLNESSVLPVFHISTQFHGMNTVLFEKRG